MRREVRAVEKPFDWKRSGRYHWKADFPLFVRTTLRAAPPAPDPGAAAAKAGKGTGKAEKK